jgi:hypothetical protein
MRTARPRRAAPRPPGQATACRVSCAPHRAGPREGACPNATNRSRTRRMTPSRETSRRDAAHRKKHTLRHDQGQPPHRAQEQRQHTRAHPPKSVPPPRHHVNPVAQPPSRPLRSASYTILEAARTPHRSARNSPPGSTGGCETRVLPTFEEPPATDLRYCCSPASALFDRTQARRRAPGLNTASASRQERSRISLAPACRHKRVGGRRAARQEAAGTGFWGDTEWEWSGRREAPGPRRVADWSAFFPPPH